ncbi:MAG TPA: PQQ-dependent sugar dehydrogenase [Humisphaera sp.]
MSFPGLFRRSHRAEVTHPAVARAASAVVEPLEGREYFATVQPGFTFSTAYTIPAGKEALALNFAPGGRIIYAEKAGNVRVIVNGTLRSTPVFSIATDGYAERGLTGLALDPNFATNGYVYAYYCRPDPSNPNQPNNNAKNRLSRFKINLSTYTRDTSVPEKILLDNLASTTGFHNGGALHFGPDGKLYVGVGEAGPPTPNGSSPASDLNSLSGKILRINPDGTIPGDNPFAGQAGKRGEIWAYGLRNPFTFAIQPGTGRIYANDVGSYKYEEVNEIVKGGNYGWPAAEGPDNGNPNYIDPVYSYSHAGGQSALTGGVFMTGGNFPASLVGKYFATDAFWKPKGAASATPFIRVIDPNTKQLMTFNGSPNWANAVNGALDLDVGPDGALYGIAPYSGKIFKIAWTGGGTSNQTPTAVAAADATSGTLPLTVHFSGAGSSDPDGDALTYTWNFGDGTTGTGLNVTKTYATAGKYSATLTVSDGKGGSDTALPIAISAGDRAPAAAVTLSAPGGTYDGGEVVSFSGTASDPEDGALPASAFSWRVELHHLDHVHPFLDNLTGKTGTFTIPKDAETSPVQWYRVYLTVTDSGGTQTTVFKDVQPNLKKLTLASNVPGISLTLDGAPQSTPTTVTGVAGTHRVITAPATQVVGGKTYKFVGWSDGGAASHLIDFPAADTTYTATYQVSGTTTGAAVTAISIINADTEKVTGTLNSGATINLNLTPRINLRAETTGTVGSVVFTLNGVRYRTENFAPYSIAGENGVDYQPWNVAPGSYTLTVTPFGGKDGTGTAGTAKTVTFTVTKTGTVAQGLAATYFDNKDFTGTTVKRTDATVNFGWGLGSPAAGIGADTFSVRWTGKIKPAATGTYTFYTQSDDAARVYVNGQLVVNAFAAHAFREDSGTITLTAGVKYDIKVEYFEGTGAAIMKLLWSGPGVAKQVVPTSALFTA